MPDPKSAKYKPTVLPRVNPNHADQYGHTTSERRQKMREARDMGKATGAMLPPPPRSRYTGK